MNASGTNAPATVLSVLLLGVALLIFRINIGAEWPLALGLPALAGRGRDPGAIVAAERSNGSAPWSCGSASCMRSVVPECS
jgi:hypothetical protein